MVDGVVLSIHCLLGKKKLCCKANNTSTPKNAVFYSKVSEAFGQVHYKQALEGTGRYFEK
jgi:hypothetical protein